MAQGAWDTGTWDAALWDSLPVTSVSGTGSPGTGTPSVTIAISGVQATGAVNGEGDSITVAISGAGATGAAGNVSLSVSPAITGTEAIGSAGTVIAVVPPIIIIDDTHDGDYKGKRFAEERDKKEKRKRDLIDLYERVVEGRPEIAAQIVEPYVKTKARGQESAPLVKQVDFDKLMRDIDKVEALYAEHIEMDDEEVLALL